MSGARLLAWTGALLLAPVALAVLFIALFGWNWLRAPIERMTLDKTGRALVIRGDLDVALGWPSPRMRAEDITFENPAWAKEKHMIVVDAVEVAVDLPQLLRRNIVFTEVLLERPVVFLEQGSEGRKNWLLDRDQRDESAHIRIGRLTLDDGRLGYDDAGQRTSIRSQLSTSGSEAAVPSITFTAQGLYKGLPLKGHGSGAAVLGLRDETKPYALKADFSVGPTAVRIDGTVTSLLMLSALDMRLALRGGSLAQLFPLLGITFPETRAYATEGHIVHAGRTWRYDKFTGRIGGSDIAGTVHVETGGIRPTIKAELTSTLLDMADLGALIGARPDAGRRAEGAAPRTAPAVALTRGQVRVLPDLPFKTDRWASVDADVALKAVTIRRAKALPVENLVAHLSLRDSVLTLDTLNFGVAGGHITAVITLDGRRSPIDARAQIRVRKLLVAKLFPAAAVDKASIGQINGAFDLTGKGMSVGRMLASANGKAEVVVANGQISKMMMEKVGLHLWEVLVLKVTGDNLVRLRCGVADFAVKNGVMSAQALVFDTEVTTILGTGTVDLGEEKLDLTLDQKTKDTSLVAFRSPIHVGGTFAQPVVGVDKGRVAARAIGAIALGLVAPPLALIPLIDAGPGKDSDCGQLVRDAVALPRAVHGTRRPGA